MSRTREVPEDKRRPTVVTLPRVPYKGCLRRSTEIRSSDDLDIDFGDARNYQLMQRIGQGTYSHVYDSFDLTKNTPCVIKKLVTSDEREVKRELVYLDILRGGPNIIRSTDILRMDVQGDTFVYGIVFEKVQNTDYRVLYRQLSDFYIRYYLYQLLRALDYAHRKGVMHRDVKPGNIVIDHERKILRLIDWGFGAMYFPGQPYYLGACTLPYRAPELLLGYRVYHYAVDMWSFGCVAAGMIFRVHMFFKGVDERTQLQHIGRLLGRRKLDEYLVKYKIRSQTERFIDRSYEGMRFESFLRPECRETATCTALNLLSRILVYDHQDRLTAAEAKRHPYFRSLRRMISQAKKTNANQNSGQQGQQNSDKEGDSKPKEEEQGPAAPNGGAGKDAGASCSYQVTTETIDAGTTQTTEAAGHAEAEEEDDEKTASIVDLGDLPDVDPTFIAGLMEDFRDGAAVEEFRRSSPNEPGPSHQGQTVEDSEYNAAEDSYFDEEDNTYDYIESDSELASNCDPTEVCDFSSDPERSPKKLRTERRETSSDDNAPLDEAPMESQCSSAEFEDIAGKVDFDPDTAPLEIPTTPPDQQGDGDGKSASRTEAAPRIFGEEEERDAKGDAGPTEIAGLPTERQPDRNVEIPLQDEPNDGPQ